MEKKSSGFYIREIPNFLALFISAFFLTSVSPIAIEMSKSLDTIPERMILIISYFMLGSFLGMAISPLLNRKIKRIYIFIVCYIIFFIQLFILIFSKSVLVFFIIYFFAGITMAVMWIQANSSMVESKVNNKGNVVNLGYIFYALSALLAPIVSSTLAKYGINWRYLYIIIIFLVVTNITLFIILRRNIDSLPPVEKTVPFKVLFKNRKANIYLLLTTIICFLYVISEAIVISWSPTFFRLYRFFDVQSAGLLLTFLWLGILAGRIIVIILARKMKTGQILIMLSAVSTASLVVLTFSRVEIISFSAIFVTGLGFSGIIPLLVSSAGNFFDKGKEIAISILFIVPQLGFSLAPYLSSSISRFNTLLSLATTVFFIAAAMVIIIVRMSYRKKAFSG